MNHSSSCVAVYPPCVEEGEVVSEVIEKLLSLDYSANKLSVIGKGSLQQDHTIGVYKTLGKIRYKGMQDELWHELWELLAGEAFFLIPEFGSLAIAGGLSEILLTENTDVNYPDDFTELGKALHLLGIPENSISQYETILQSGQLIVIVHGNNKEIEYAGHLLEHSQSVNEVSLHFVNTG